MKKLLTTISAVLFSIIFFSTGAIAAIQCYECHGTSGPADYRPLDATHRNISTGGFPGNHRNHMGTGATPASCNPCHGKGVDVSTYPNSHRDGNIDMVANINNSPKVGGATYSRGVSFSQTPNPTTGTCSNVNCHFESTTPAWGSAAFTTPNDCSQCHGTPPNGGATGAAGSHAKHDSYYSGVANCSKCHSDHIAEPSAFSHATSAGKRDLNISFAAAPNNGSGAYSGPLNDYLPSQTNVFGKCTATYCHSTGSRGFAPYTSNGTATWGGSLTCKGCHKAEAFSGAEMSTGSHLSHINNALSYTTIKCVSCHAVTANANMTISDVSKHVNSSVEIAFNNTSSAANGSYNGSLATKATPSVKASGSPVGSCQNVYCHSAGQHNDGTVLIAGDYATPTWNSAATGQCGTCHALGGSTDHGGFPGYVKASPAIASGKHTKHLSYTYGISDGDLRCAICHAYNNAAFTTNSPSCSSTCHGGSPNNTALKHANYEVNVNIANYFGASASYSGTTKPGDGYGSCGTVYCHSDGLATPVSYTTPSWSNSATGACGTCHGVTAAVPPASIPHAKHVGSANQYRFACAECHSSTVENTADSTTTPTIKASTGYVYHVNKNREILYDATNLFGTYSAAVKRCGNLYCHSTGNISVAPGNLPGVYGNSVYVHQGWTGTVSCNSCHGRSTSNGMPDYTNAGTPGSATSNSHARHVTSSNISCAECHEKTTKNGTSVRSTVSPSYHVNAARDVFFNLSGNSVAGTYNSGAKTCSATYCHGVGASLAWGDSTSCNSCHSANAASSGGGGINNWGAGTPISAHKLHVEETTLLPSKYTNYSVGNLSASTTTYRFGCASCHNPAQTAHVSGYASGSYRAQVFFGYTSPGKKPTYTYTGTAGTADNGFAWSNGNTVCNSTYCHSDGNGGAGAAVSWATTANSSPATTRCKQCHNYTVGSGAAIITGDHTVHISANYNFSCRKCHAATTVDGSTIADKTQHVNKQVNVAFNNTTTAVNGTYNGLASPMAKSPGSAYASCGSTYCHSKGTSAASPSAPNLTATWGSTLNTTCSGCHGNDNSSDFKMGTVGSTTHAKHVQTYTYGCVKCHETTVSANRTISNYVSHVNRQVNIEFNNSTTAVSGTYAGSASPMTKLPGTAMGTCTNTYCHSKGTSLTPSAAVPNIVPNWTNNLDATCSSCHGGDNSVTNKMGTVGSTTHAKHIQTYTYGCVKCHETTVSANRTISNYASHVNRQVNIEFNNSTTAVSGTYNGSASPMTKLPGTATGTCTNTYCHSKGTSLTPSAAVPNIVPNWTNNLDATCTSCHGGDNSATSKMGTIGSVAHTKHIQTYGYGCVKCHETTVSANRTISSTASHVNRQVNIEFNNSTTAVSGTYNGSASPMTKLPGTATGTCTNTYCHSKGTSLTPSAAVPNIVPNWTTNLDATCTSCHGGDNSATSKMGTVGSATHAEHVQVYGYDCSYCHAATVTNSRTIGTIANHVNRMVDVQFSAWPNSSATYIGTTPKSKLPGSAAGACGNTYCHSNGTSVASGTIPANTSVNWGTAGPLACNSCHGTESATSGGAPRYSHLMRLPAAQAGATWTTPANALLGDKAFATYAGTAQGTLILTNFGYTTAQVADADTVTGITVIVEGWAASGTTPGNQLNIQLTQNGTAGVGTAKTISLPGTTSAANADVYATTITTDLWGATWTPAQVRAATFGVILKDNDTTSSGLNVDMVKVIIHTNRAPKMNNHSSAVGHRVVTCNICHDSVTYSAGTYTPVVALHVNKAYNVQTSLGYTYAANGGTCGTPGNGCHGPTAGKWGGTLGCVDCHNKVITRTKGRPGTTLANVVGEFGLAWGHKKTGRAAVTDDDCIVCHLEGDGTSHKASAKHQDGNIDLRDPDIEGETAITNMSGGAFTFQRFSTSYAASTRYSNGQTLNNIDNVITQKLCLACHDSNGATNTKARSNNGGTGTATRPFGGIDMGANYSVVNGAAAANSMVDVKTQLATTNSSKHPVLGPLNRDFPTAARMNDPYKPTGTRGTSGTQSNGVVINCFDCHNVVGTPLTRRTVTAHGNAVTVRGYPIANTSGTPFTTTSPADANKPTLCIVCHADYDTQAPHGTGSAWSASMNAGMANVVKFGCNICHASNYATAVVRPVRAQDSHGSNALPAGGMGLRAGGRWATTGKPIAFIRNTFVIDDHAPKKVGATTYSPTCMSASGTANPSYCGNQGTQSYTVGGTY